MNDPSTPVSRCSNCDAFIEAEQRFCGQCGQEARKLDESLKGFVMQFLGDYFTFDSKIARSIRPLLFAPGSMTKSYLEGKRVRYIPPLRMYIFISIVFFLVLSTKGSPADVSDPETLFWNRFFEVHLPRLFFVFLPIFAGILQLIYVRKKGSSYVRHFVFSLHFHSFTFILALAFLGVSELLARAGFGVVNPFIAAACIGLLLLYLLVAVRRVYGSSWGRALLSTAILVCVYGVLLSVLSLLMLVLLSAS